MNINDINVIVDLRKTLNLSKTAKNLYLSQPHVSMIIKRLEKKYHQTLFLRNDKFEFTDAGIKLHNYFENIQKLQNEFSHKLTEQIYFSKKKYEIFNSVYEFSNISKSSKKLNMTAANVSISISNFEKEINRLLFIRDANKITPSKDAKFIYDYTSQILDLFSQLENEFLISQINIIKVGINQGIKTQFLDLPNKLYDNNDNTIVSVVVDIHNNILELLKNGKIDVAILDINKMNFDNEFNVTIISVDKLCAAVYQGHKLYNAHTISIHDLVNEKILARNKKTLERLILENSARENECTIIPFFESMNRINLLNWCSQGYGIAILPESIIKTYAKNINVQCVEVLELTETINFVILNKKNNNSLIIMNYIEYIENVISSFSTMLSETE